MQTQLEVESRGDWEIRGKGQCQGEGGEEGAGGPRGRGGGQGQPGGAAALPTRPPGARARAAGSSADSHGLTAKPLSTPAGGRFRGRPACGLLPCRLRCEGRNKNKTNHGTRSRPAAGGRGNLSHVAPGSGRGDPAAVCSLQTANFDKESAKHMEVAGANLRRIRFSGVRPTTPLAGHCPGGVWEGTDLERRVEFNCIRIYSSLFFLRGKGVKPLRPGSSLPAHPHPDTAGSSLQRPRPKRAGSRGSDVEVGVCVGVGEGWRHGGGIPGETEGKREIARM